MRLVDPAWWSREGRSYYAPLVRWQLAALKASPAGPTKNGLYAQAGTNDYEMLKNKLVGTWAWKKYWTYVETHGDPVADGGEVPVP
jgi:hypothetical protein